MRFDINKIKKYIYLSLPAIVLSSCAYDDFDDAGSRSMPKGEKMYITIQVKSNDGFNTRAIPEDSNYENGEAEIEHPTADNIQGAHAIFFDVYGNFMAMADMNPMDYDPEGPHADADLHNPPNENGIEASYSAVIEASREESEQPKYVIVVLNDIPVLSQLEAKANPGSKIKDFTDIIWSDLQGDGNRISQTFAGAATSGNGKAYLTLSNAAYLDKDDKGQTIVHYEYVIPKGSFKDTQEEAKKSKGVVVHVERMVSKFTPIFLGYTPDKLTYRPYDGNQLTIAHFDEDGEASYEAQNWNMTITGWGMNGIETKNYLFKKIQNTSYYGWSAENSNGWNDTYQWRSYWAEDPHYKEGEGLYPFQYRRAVEKNHDTEFKYYGDQTNHGVFENREENQTYDWALKYYSFNELNNSNRIGSESYSEHAYAPENTYDKALSVSEDLDYKNKRNNKIAGTHMLFCSDLSVTVDGLNNFQEIGKNNHFYRDRIGICYYNDVDLFWGFTRAVNRKLESQGYMQYTYYTWDERKVPSKPDSRYFEGSGKMKLYYGDELITYDLVKRLKAEGADLWIPAPILHGDGKVFPWVVPANENGTWLDVNKLNIRDEKGNDKDSDGKPVQKTFHRGDYNDATKTYDYTEIGEFTVEDLASLFYEWCGAVDDYFEGKMYYAAPILHSKQEENGSQDIYGNVRNHWYQLKINTVLNLGTPVNDPEQRIIPDNVYGNNNLKVDVELLPWHILDFFIDLPNLNNNVDDTRYKPKEND